MKNARDQDTATGVISLGLLANKLTWLLIGGRSDLPLLKVNKSIFEQWKTVLRETIDFIQTLETGATSRQAGVAPRFLSRAQYLEQIYTAAPSGNKKNLKALAEYLQSIHDDIERLSKDERLAEAKKENLLSFTSSIANESIQEASRFHQETHVRRTSESLVEMHTK